MQVTKKVSVDLVITNAKIGLRKMKVQFPEKLIIAHLNFNYIRNNFDSLSFMIENKETHYSIQRLSWMFHFHQVNSIYVNLVYLIDMRDSLHKKTYFIFPNVLKRWSFQNNRTGIWSFLYCQERWYFIFQKIWSYSLYAKVKMIISQKKIHGNKMFFSNVLKRWYFQKKKSHWNMIFFVISGKIFFV